MTQAFDDAAREVDRAQTHLRWCIESGEPECGLHAARECLVVADENFHLTISAATVAQREAFIIANQAEPTSL